MSCSCAKVKTGDFNREVIVFKADPITEDDQGGRVPTFTEFKIIRVKVTQKSGGESFTRDSMTTNENLSFLGWFDSSIEADKGIYRLEYRDKEYNIVNVNNLEQKDLFMDITAKLERFKTA